MSDTSKLAPFSLDTRITVPEHVVYRNFVEETVVLNLQTGNYHGLNPTGGTMLDVLQRSATVRDALTELVESYQQPQDVIERDLLEFCDELLSRGLIDAE
jgi:hypothetical protein